MKRFCVFVMMLFTAAALLNGCGKTESKPAETENVIEEDAKEEQKAVEEAEEVSEADDMANKESENSENADSAEPDVENPLKGDNVLYPGALKAESGYLAALVQYFMESNQTAPESILMVNADDFDRNGTYEAFLFAGEEIEEEYEHSYTGSMWYTDGNMIEKVGDSVTDAWWSVDGYINCENRSYAFANEYFATGALSLVWSVYDGKPKTCEISDLGDVAVDDDGAITIVHSTYDATYDMEMGTLLGHSWKPYYYYYDAAADCIKEYGGAYLNKDKINEYCGFDLVSEIETEEREIINALYRENGLLHVNYITRGEYEIGFGNATYDCLKKEYVPYWTGTQDAEAWKVSANDGIYLPSRGTEYVSFPEVEKKTEDIEIYVMSSADIVGNGDCVLLHNSMSEEENSVYAVVDLNTQFSENGIEAGYYEEGMRPIDWMYALLNVDDPTQRMGVYAVTVTNDHVDRINGLYWWD